MNDYKNARTCPSMGCRVPTYDAPNKPVCEYAAESLSGIEGLALGMAYVPMQKFENLYDTDMAFKAGTIFKALDKPFCGRCIR